MVFNEFSLGLFESCIINTTFIDHAEILIQLLFIHHLGNTNVALDGASFR